MDETGRDLTEDEQDAVGRLMLKAALEALGVFPADEERDDMARRVIAALAAAEKVRLAENNRISLEIGKYAYITTEAHEAVATAFWMWSEKIELDVSEVFASSVIGTRYLALAQGLAAARAMSEALNMVEDGSAFAFTSRGALHWSENQGLLLPQK